MTTTTYQKRNRTSTGRFRPELLPPPHAFYSREIGKLTRPSRGWARGDCPFHKSQSKTSFSVNLDSGGFYCFGCGAHGGDVVAFARLRYDVGFREACQHVGAWDEAGRRPKKLKRVVVGRDLVMDFSINGTGYTARVKDDPRDFADLLRRVKAEACDRLTEIGRGDSEKFDGEGELQWQITADSHQLIRNEELANGF